MREKEGLLLKASRLFDVPGDVVAGQPRLEMIGTGELRLEQHHGILAYGPREIHISLGRMVLQVSGEDLELRAMTPNELLITGEIRKVEMV